MATDPPAPAGAEDLREQLIAAELAVHIEPTADGSPDAVRHSNREAADRAMAVVTPKLERLQAQLAEASDALRAAGKAALTVAPTLRQPYRDAPETSPWEQFVKEPARRAYTLGARIRRQLKETDRG